MSSDMETAVYNLGLKLLEAAKEDDGKINTYLFSMAAADAVAANLRLLPEHLVPQLYAAFIARFLERCSDLGDEAEAGETIN